jgi:transcriptional regulator with XRE-family HTH domain
MSFGERLLEALAAVDMTQVDFAARMDVKKATVNDWVKNRHKMSLDDLKRAAKVLGIKLEDIAAWVHESLLEDLGVAKSKRSR